MARSDQLPDRGSAAPRSCGSLIFSCGRRRVAGSGVLFVRFEMMADLVCSPVTWQYSSPNLWSGDRQSIADAIQSWHQEAERAGPSGSRAGVRTPIAKLLTPAEL